MKDAFSFQRGDIVNKETAERVAKWQTMESPPEGHSIPLIEIGKRILEGDQDVEEAEEPHVPTETSDLVEQAKELAKQEAKLKSSFPAAAKILNPELENPSGESSSMESSAENGHETESSGVLVETEDCASPSGSETEDGKRISMTEDPTPDTDQK
jgi:hypothetical protein